MLAVKELGHVGLYCTDVEKSLDFYTRILGLTVTDAHPEGHIIFLSAQPESEHHELALCPGRDTATGSKGRSTGFVYCGGFGGFKAVPRAFEVGRRADSECRESWYCAGDLFLRSR